MGDERGPWIGSSWMVSTVRAGDRRPQRPRVLVTWAVGAAVLMGVLGAAGPHTPVDVALPLPPVDTSEVGATGRAPDAGVAPLPELADPFSPGLLPGTGSGSGVPETMLAAYRSAEGRMARSAPDCHLPWALVAGIGKVESSHAYGGAVGGDGTTLRPILGPQLDGTNGNAAIGDTDGGALDHDTTWDRAVGPTQFIPSSWRTYGADGNGDGTSDPDNAFDATLATGRYLCAGGTDLATASGRHDAVFRYNHSESYVATVLRWADGYASGALPVPDSEGGIPDVDPGSPASPASPVEEGAPTLAALPSSVLPDAGPVPSAPAPTGLVGGSPVPLSAPAAAPTGGVPAVPSSSASALPGAVPSSSASALPGAVPSSGALASSGSSSPVVPPSRPSTSAPGPTTPKPTTPASSTPPSSTPPSTTTTSPTTTTPPSTTTTPPTTPSPAARCTASLPAVAKAFGVPAAQLTAATANGPKAGQVTCTVRRSGTPLVVAVAATTASAPAPAAGAGVTRSAAGGRVVLSVPPSAGVPEATAKAALAKLASAWA